MTSPIAKPLPPNAEAELSIGGMTCAACVSKVERSLLSVPGVEQATVNLATERARIEFNDELAGREALERAVTSIGFEVRPDVSGAVLEAEEELDRDRHDLVLRRRLFLGALLGILVHLGSHAERFPFPLGPLSSPYVLFALSVPVLTWCAWPFHRGLLASLRRGSADMNTLISLGSSAAFLYSTVAVFAPDLFPADLRGHGDLPPLYFDGATAIVALILLGRLLEARARRKTRHAIRRLGALRPSTARVETDAGDIVQVPIERVRRGDFVQVLEGERIPVDGTLLQGSSHVDESMLTGESRPIEKSKGDNVYGGTINQGRSITLEATEVGEQSALAQIIKMVEDAQSSKAPVQRLADQIAGKFVPVVLVIALLTAIAWWSFGPDPKLAYTLVTFISVLIIACPCALGLATPTAVLVGTGRAAERGIFFRGGESLEHAAAIDTVVFDKTGTLTVGRPELTTMKPIGEHSLLDVLRWVASVEQESTHPLARALTETARANGLALARGESVTTSEGGITGHVEGLEVRAGNLSFLESTKGFHPGSGSGSGSTPSSTSGPASASASASASTSDSPGSASASTSGSTPMGKPTLSSASRLWDELRRESNLAAENGESVVGVLIDGRPAAVFGISDRVRDESADAVRDLQNHGVQVVLLSGDHPSVVARLAEAIGIKEAHGALLPQDKARIVREMQSRGRRVAMVGDGINDAPALAEAHIGIALGSGTDVAVETADVTLMRPDLRLVQAALGLSQKTLGAIRQNLFWAFLFNTIGIPIAAGVLYPFFGVLLQPAVAAAAMSASSVLVVGNSLRLRGATSGR